MESRTFERWLLPWEEALAKHFLEQLYIVHLERGANTGRILDIAICLTVARKERKKTNPLLLLAFSEMGLVSWSLGSPHTSSDALAGFLRLGTSKDAEQLDKRNAPPLHTLFSAGEALRGIGLGLQQPSKCESLSSVFPVGFIPGTRCRSLSPSVHYLQFFQGA